MAKHPRRQLHKALLRLNPKCSYCNRPVTITNSNLDHVIPKFHGGTNKLGNLVLTCIKCNSTKGNMTTQQWEEVLPLLLRDKYFEMTKKQKRKWRKKLPKKLAEYFLQPVPK